jgi:hypothetical protein
VNVQYQNSRQAPSTTKGTVTTSVTRTAPPSHERKPRAAAGRSRRSAATIATGPMVTPNTPGCLIQNVAAARAPLAASSRPRRHARVPRLKIAHSTLAVSGKRSSISLVVENPCTDGAALATMKSRTAQAAAGRPAIAAASAPTHTAVAPFHAARNAWMPTAVGGTKSKASA